MTGQYPRRRETDREARRRVEHLERRAAEHRAQGVPISEALARFYRPRINASGRLTSNL